MSRSPLTQRELGKQQELPEGAGTFGLLLFFVSLAVLFLSSAIGVVVVRAQFDAVEFPVQFPKAGWPLSTALLIATSLCLHLAVRALRIDESRRFLTLLGGALAAGTLFFVTQAIFWNALFDQQDAQIRSVESGFYAVAMLTILHAAHVLGGVLWLGVVFVRAVGKRYWSLSHGQVRGIALYWHFIDAVWILLLGFLFWLTGGA